MKSSKSNEWILMEWGGNPDLNLKCYRKKFGKGHVSVGCGEFLTICYSFGANSDHSYSCTRWRKDGAITEKDAMDMIDKKFNHEVV